MVLAVIEALNPDRVIHIGEGEENITFTLPKELREVAPAPQNISQAILSV